MAARAETAVRVETLTVHRRAAGTIAVVGNPNAGKSSVFNRLTGLRQRTANYPGVTVERHIGRSVCGGTTLDLIDLPGTYSLSPNSTDERIAVDVLFGRVVGTPCPDAILAVIDSTRLYQGLYLLQQLVELGRPMLVALTMADAAQREGLKIDYAALEERLGGVRVYPVVATTGRGFSELKGALARVLTAKPPQLRPHWPELRRAAESFAEEWRAQGLSVHPVEVERLLVEPKATTVVDARRVAELEPARKALFGSAPPLAVEARHRYRWVNETLAKVESPGSRVVSRGAAFVDWLNRPWPATALFVLAMAVVFQAVFAWAKPFKDLIDGGASGLGVWIKASLPTGALSSFVADGAIAGVGSVVTFLPQILFLFLFIILMEDTGYLARAAFLVDRAMRSVGLSGQSVIPLLSSFACAVPAIMATRVIPNRRDRIATILAAPFMTCSARLPVYALMIGAFVPVRTIGLLNIQGLVLFGLYVVGILGGVGTALLLRYSLLRGEHPTFILALPEFRLPNARTVAMKLLDRVRVFLRRAGTVIFAVAIVAWALTYYPRTPDVDAARDAARVTAAASLTGVALDARVAEIQKQAAAEHLARSWLGRAGQFVEPAFKPLGWDWRVSAAVIAGFPAREVVVAVLGTIYAVGNDADDQTLSQRLQSATWPDGRTVFTLPMVLGLLLFYAWCLQCAATLAVIRRETNSWGWPLFAWSYMTILGYGGALAIYQLGGG
ncbi:MAG TPA: ferrous iron transport protein B [Gammaproteobacteria bacterium]|jgi:ferrous iron transport protein B|nr:ferrous iron transport protein B [Gammaproteobacteria bacterium]